MTEQKRYCNRNCDILIILIIKFILLAFLLILQNQKTLCDSDIFELFFWRNNYGAFYITMKHYKLKEILRQIRQGSDIQIQTFKDLLSSQLRLSILHSKIIKLSYCYTLITTLLHLNLQKFIITIFLLIFQFVLVISAPFFTNILIHNYLGETSSLIELCTLFILYKLIKALIGILCDFCYFSVGYEYFARICWHILNNYNLLTGKTLNLIEYDCNLLSNLSYALLTSLFHGTQLIAIITLLLIYLWETTYKWIFITIIITYLFCQIIVNYLTFKLNRNYLRQKDRRLAFNINNLNSTQILTERQKELIHNRRFLYLKIFYKIITLIFPTLLLLYIFLLAQRSIIEDNVYILLILVNLLRASINELMLTGNMMVEIYYSCRRIIKNNTNIIERRTDQSLNVVLNCENQDNSLPNNIDLGLQLNQEKGTISFNRIIRYCSNNHISKWKLLLLILLIICLLLISYYNFYVTKDLISQNFTSFDCMILTTSILLPLFIYFLLISISQQIAHSVFKTLKKEQPTCELINRISGDIYSIDRNLTLNTFQLISTLSFILGSYLFSILSLHNLQLQFILLIFLISCMGIIFKLNRKIMDSRREVARKECGMKAGIIGCLFRGDKINHNNEMSSYLRYMFECKQMGLFIENYFIGMLNLILLCLSLLLLVASHFIDLSEIERGVIFLACFNVDGDLMNMFYAGVRLQLSLVSFERVLNAISTS